MKISKKLVALVLCSTLSLSATCWADGFSDNGAIGEEARSFYLDAGVDDLSDEQSLLKLIDDTVRYVKIYARWDIKRYSDDFVVNAEDATILLDNRIDRMQRFLTYAYMKFKEYPSEAMHFSEYINRLRHSSDVYYPVAVSPVLGGLARLTGKRDFKLDELTLLADCIVSRGCSERPTKFERKSVINICRWFSKNWNVVFNTLSSSYHKERIENIIGNSRSQVVMYTGFYKGEKLVKVIRKIAKNLDLSLDNVDLDSFVSIVTWLESVWDKVDPNLYFFAEEKGMFI